MDIAEELERYTGPVVTGPPAVGIQLKCQALVKVRKGVYRHCRRTPEFSATLTNNRGYSVAMCFTHVYHTDEVTLAVEVF